MSILSTIFSGGTKDLVEGVGNVIDDLHTSKEEKLEAEQKIKELVASYQTSLEKEISTRWDADMKCKVDSVSATTGAVVTILGTLSSTGETKLPEIKISDLAIEERLYSVTSKEDDDKNIDIIRKLLIR